MFIPKFIVDKIFDFYNPNREIYNKMVINKLRTCCKFIYYDSDFDFYCFQKPNYEIKFFFFYKNDGKNYIEALQTCF